MTKKVKELKENLMYNIKNFWTEASKQEKESAFDFADGYKNFLDKAKTERESIDFVENELVNRGFSKVLEKKSNKVYKLSRHKNAAIALVGNSKVSEGVNLIVSHIDAPRIDLKQRPLYEDGELKIGLLRTHYYGGIKKYQWMSTPLSLHGIVIKNDGEKVEISIGEDENDPIFIMPDLLPHLAKSQYSKKIGEAISADQMNIIFNSIPFPTKEEKDLVKLNALNLLNQKYGITEADLLSAELEIVPAGKARDAGIDASFIAGYGQDDRVCAYTSFNAIFDSNEKDMNRTAVVYLADKEEIGSDGNTGAKSNFIISFLADLLKHNGEDYSSYNVRKTLENSHILSADVNAAINPNYPSVHENSNAVHLGFGVSLTKFTGSRGKGGTNDANAEFMAKIVTVFNNAKVNWQIGELGKVDEGGGGTIAKFMAEYGAEVIDCGPGVLGMHSLYELTSKADVYSTYKAYKAFLNS